MSFEGLKLLSFAHSAIYLTLLTVWLVPEMKGPEICLLYTSDAADE